MVGQSNGVVLTSVPNFTEEMLMKSITQEIQVKKSRLRFFGFSRNRIEFTIKME